MLTVRDLDAFYGRAQILHGLSLDVAAGEVLVVLGRNGAGKSTLFKAVMGLVRRQGQVRFQDQNIAGWETHRIARAGLGYVPEDRRVFADLTVLENLEVGRHPARTGRAWTPGRLFELFPNLGAMPHRPGNRMSGGEQQMLAIARTLMGNPSLVLLDEPSEGLAPVIVQQMAAAIRALRHEGITIVLAEQNLHFAREIADRAVVIERGRVAWSGTIDALMADPEARAAHLAV